MDDDMTCSGHFLTRGCRKMVEKWHAAVAPSTFASQTVQTLAVCITFGGSDVAEV